MIKIQATLILVLFLVSGALAQESFNFAKSNNYFTFETYRNLTKNDKNSNVCFSPLSIYEAMAMVYNGAKGETKKEFQTAIKLPSEVQELNSAYVAFNKEFTNSIKSVDVKKANALWLQKNYCFLSEYKNRVATNYNANLELVNFKKQRKRKKSVAKINKWASKNTNGKIPNLLNEDLIKESTRLIITNAMYFNGMWQTPFKTSKNTQKIFYGTKGDTKTTFIGANNKFNFYSDKTIQVLELPYKNENQSMFIILPQKRGNLQSIEKSLNSDFLKKVLSRAQKTSVTVSIPKFKSSSDYELSKLFKNMGVKSAFSESADFSGITGKPDLFIDKVFHKTTVEFSEKGTEAAASTAVVITRKSASVSERFNANHPFVYFISDKKTGAILFMGRITNVE